VDQGAILTVALAIFIGGITLAWFLAVKAPTIPRTLERRATDAAVVLVLAAAERLKDLRAELNEALRPHDIGQDPYLLQVKYDAPFPLLREYKQLVTLERVVRRAPAGLQSQIRGAFWLACGLDLVFFVTIVLACLKDLIGLVPAHLTLALGGVGVAGALVFGFFFIRPHRLVHKGEIRAQAELAAMPAVAVAADALGVGGAAPTNEVDDAWS
jgi:hypothetical protein